MLHTIEWDWSGNLWLEPVCSNRRDILRIQSGTDRYWENSTNKFYHKNGLKIIDRVYDCVHVNVCVRYDSPMTGNSKPWVIYANVVWVLMRKHTLSQIVFNYLGYQCETLVDEPLHLSPLIYEHGCWGGIVIFQHNWKIHDDQENQYKGQYRQKKPLLTMKILSGSRISSMDAATTWRVRCLTAKVVGKWACLLRIYRK